MRTNFIKIAVLLVMIFLLVFLSVSYQGGLLGLLLARCFGTMGMDFLLKPFFKVTPIGLICLILCFLPFRKIFTWLSRKERRKLAERRRIELANKDLIISLDYLCIPLIDRSYIGADDYFYRLAKIDRALTILRFTANDIDPFLTEQFVGDMRRLFDSSEVEAMLTSAAPKALRDLRRVLKISEEGERRDERFKPISNQIKKAISDYECISSIKPGC